MSAMSTSTSSSLTSRNAVDNGRKSSTSITFIVPARRKELSTPTLAVSKKKKKKMLKGNGVDGYNIKRGDVIDRIDVYNQYDEENIEIDEQPVSQEFTVRILASLNRSFIEQSAKAASVYSSRLSFHAHKYLGSWPKRRNCSRSQALHSDWFGTTYFIYKLALTSYPEENSSIYIFGRVH